MAIYHATLKIYSRSAGHTATAAAAYRAGSRVADEGTGMTHDYTRRRDVVSADLFAPDGAPPWASDTAALWNAAERAERRRNACVARELEVSLPVELDRAQRCALAHDLARMLVDRYRVAVLAAVHQPNPGNDERNHHVHLLFSTRVLEAHGFGAKVRVLDDRSTGPAEVRALRAEVADRINAALNAAGVVARVDHRSLEQQARRAVVRGDLDAVAALARDPTRHLGRATAAAVRAGRSTHRGGEHAERIRANVFLLQQSRQRAAALRAEHDRRARGSGARSPPHRNRPTRSPGGSRSSAPPATLPLSPFLPEETQMYIDDLQRTARRIHDDFRRAMVRDDEIAALARWGVRSAENVAFLARLREADAEVREAEDQLLAARGEYGRACVATQHEREALERIDAAKPSAVRLVRRRRWGEQRRDQEERLTEAARTERRLLMRVVDGGPMPVVVAIAEKKRLDCWNALRAAEQASRTPGPGPAPVAPPASRAQGAMVGPANAPVPDRRPSCRP